MEFATLTRLDDNLEFAVPKKDIHRVFQNAGDESCDIICESFPGGNWVKRRIRVVGSFDKVMKAVKERK